ncbi:MULTISPECIES: prepilin peptidase [Citrobacter]|uniref:prepilin peptidase n=1 Tax=Citrobacter TaxID=544 RepID=UPI001C0BC2B2|nr:A24 family peptidase [Citrobacter youngae]MBU3799331.1 prepilin peptidase [Citrobacter youngae]
MVYFFIYWVGSVVASFICLAVERLPHQLKWRDEPIPDLYIWYPPSFCDFCKVRLKWYTLIPFFGYFLSKGKCHSCHSDISIKYPLIEFSVGLLSVVLYIAYDNTQHFIILLCILYVLIFLTLIDVKEMWLPSVVTYPLFWGGLLCPEFCSEPLFRIYGALFCCVVTYFSMLLVGVVKNEDVFAGGDIALATAAGAWLGLEHSFIFIILSSLIFIVYSVPFRFLKIIYVPMGPALSLGFFICLLQFH